MFDEAKAEASKLGKQPLPSNFCQDDLDSFSYDLFHKELGEEAPVLRAAISGSMATNNTFTEIEVTPCFLKFIILRLDNSLV